MKRQKETSSAFIVECGYMTEKGEENFKVAVPEGLLWSSRGVRILWERLREGYLANPKDYPEDMDVINCWDSFHIIGIQELNGIRVFNVGFGRYE